MKKPPFALHTTTPQPLERAIIEKRDKALIHLACNGDHDAFEKLVRLHENRVRALGLSFFKNENDTDDFIQEVFIKVYKSLKSFKGESLFSTWLMRIAYNTAINSIKRRKEYLSLNDKIEIEDTDYGPEELEFRKQTKQAIQEAMKELPARYASCLDLYFFYDMSHKDISFVLDIPVNTIKSHIFRAKKILRKNLENVIKHKGDTEHEKEQ